MLLPNRSVNQTVPSGPTTSEPRGPLRLWGFGSPLAKRVATLTIRPRGVSTSIVGLRWATEGGQAAWRRLLAGPQFWCATLPIAWAVLVLLGDTTRFFVPLKAVWGLASCVNAVVGPTLLLVGALACIVVACCSPSRLVRRG